MQHSIIDYTIYWKAFQDIKRKNVRQNNDQTILIKIIYLILKNKRK